MIAFTILANYEVSLLRLLKALEAPHADARDVGDGVITIGLGFNINAKAEVRNEVIQALLGSPVGVAAAQSVIESEYRARLQTTVGDVTLTVSQRIAKLNGIMAERAADTALNGYVNNRRTSFSFSSDPVTLNAEVDGVFARIKGLYDTDLKRVFPALKDSAGDFVAGFVNSREHAVLFSFVYNGGPGLVGPNLRAAIASGDRARAWYEIRYQSNKLGWAHINGTASTQQLREIASNVDAGLAKRRYFESQVFGLYASSTATLDEAKGTVRMLTRFRTEIFKYENTYGTRRDGSAGSRGDKVASAITDYQGVADIARPQALVASLDPAKVTLLADLRTRYATYADKLADGNFLSTNLYLAAAGTAANFDSDQFETAAFAAANKNDLMWGDAKVDLLSGNQGNDALIGEAGNDVLKGADGADLLIGGSDDDALSGGAGNDTLDGGSGQDVIEGGAGVDVLSGGAGDDVYVWKSGDGNDTIIDADGGRLIVNGGEAFQFSGGLMRQEGDTNVWVDASGNVKLTHNSPWRLELSDGSIIQLGEGFDPLEWGITLESAPDEPISTYTGDFTKKTKTADPSQYELSGLNYVNERVLAGSADIITGSTGADDMKGLGGNDGLAGRNGDDLIDGGEGADLLLGGAGSDHIVGGAGNDLIFGSGAGGLSTPTSVNFVPPTAEGPELARGFSWVAFEDPQPDSSGRANYVIRGADPSSVQNDDGNIIDGGAGDDLIRAGTGADAVRGGDGADDVQGLGGDDELFGGAGNDRIHGDGVQGPYVEFTPLAEHGDDLLAGDAGNDTLVGQGGDDYLDGGDDNDQLFGDQLGDGEIDDTPAQYHGSDVLFGGAGDDCLEGDGGSDDLSGEAGNDSLHGDASTSLLLGQFHGADLLDGGDGRDSLWGDGGDDVLVGGIGDDELQGDADAATVDGQFHGADMLDGGEGNDWLSGQGGADQLTGGAGNDELQGDAATADVDSQFHGADVLDGGEGNDRLFGQGGDDHLFGGVGNDDLVGDDLGGGLAIESHGADVLDGGGGDDHLWGNGGADTLDGGDGNDWLAGGDEMTTDASSVLLGDDQISGGSGSDTLLGGAGADALFGDEGDDWLIGGEGNDLLIGGSGIDVLDGGVGDDVFEVDGVTEWRIVDGVDKEFADSLKSTAGFDVVQLAGLSVEALSIEATIDVDGAAALTSDGGTILLLDAATTSIRTIQSEGGAIDYERFFNEEFNDQVIANSDGVSGRLLGGAANDWLTVNAGHSQTTVSAGLGDDSITIQSSQGSTVNFRRGDGADTVTAAARSQSEGIAIKNVLQLGPGINPSDLSLVLRSNGWISLDLGAEDSISFQLPAGTAPEAVPVSVWPFDEIRFEDGTVYGWGDVIGQGVLALPDATPGDDVVALSAVADAFNGLDGNDFVDGAAGNDTLHGGSGDDTLIGGKGNDVLVGGFGGDEVTGGEGDDQLIDDPGWDIAWLGEGNDRYSWAGGNDTAIDDAVSNDAYEVSFLGGNGGASPQWFITDLGGVDELIMPWGVTSTDVSVRNDGGSLTFRIQGSMAAIHVDALDSQGDLDPSRLLESVRFSDGTTWTTEQVRALTLATSPNADSIVGYSAAESIDGGSGNDQIAGAGGDDTLYGGAGSDWLSGGAGNDVLAVGPGGGHMVGGAGDDVYRVAAGDGSVVIGNVEQSASDFTGNDRLEIATRRDRVTVSLERASVSWFGEHDKVIISLNDGSARIEIAAVGRLDGDLQLETIKFSDGAEMTIEQLISNLVPSGTNEADLINGTSFGERILALDGDDYVHGAIGDDWIDGGNGNDWIDGGLGDDHLDGGAGNDRILAGSGSNTVEFGAGDGNDTVELVRDPTGIDTVQLGAGITIADVQPRWASIDRGDAPDELRLFITSTGQTLTIQLPRGSFDEPVWREDFVVNRLRFSDGSEMSFSALVDRANAATAQSDTLIDANGSGHLTGLGGADELSGRDGDDLIDGGEGNDTLEGGQGNDTMIGGSGDDVFRDGVGTTTVRIDRSDGNDYYSEANSILDTGLRIEFQGDIVATDIALTRPTFDPRGALIRISNGGTLSLRISDESDLPNQMSFSNGTVLTSADIVRLATAGTADEDTLVGFDSTNDMLAGDDGDDVLYGLSGGDQLSGGAGNDTLYGDDGMSPYQSYGPSGHDVLIGGAGDDRLVAGEGAVTYRFDQGFGHDTIAFSRENTIPGGATVEFGAGIAKEDVVVSRLVYGDLLLRLASTGDTVVIEDFFPPQFMPAYSAVDRVQFADGSSWTRQDLVALMVSSPSDFSDEIDGTAGPDLIAALAGNDIVRGLGGDDQLFGGGGDDQLLDGEGNDLIDGGFGNDEARAGTGADSLYGGAGNDTLDGGIGTDTVQGGEGDDLILGYSGDGADQIMLASAWGHDILTTFDGDELRFGSNVSSSELQLWRTASGDFVYDALVVTHEASDSSIWIDGFYGALPPSSLRFGFSDATSWSYTDAVARVRGIMGGDGDDEFAAVASNGELRGMGGDDRLTGSSGADTLNGGMGRDTLIGGAGNDEYVVDVIGETVTESSSSGGNDTVRSSVNWTLGTNVENLVLLGAETLSGTGNSLNNVITGNAAANVLNGGSGADTLSGGAGNDTYVIDSTSDLVVENVSEGIDLVQSSVSLTLGANVEQLTLTGTSAINATGNALDNALTGNSGANVLTGLGGNDTLSGGAGNDTYVVDSAFDVVTEIAGQGTDLVQSSISWALTTEVENLTLTGSLSINAAGNSASNTLTGNTGANVLDGGAGVDTLVGGTGNDTYVVDNVSDVVTEGSSAGTDAVLSSMTWTLGSNLEQLTLTGAAAINGTGNTLANLLTGNSAANVLNGGSGADILIGGGGDDIYVVDSTSDVTTENAGEGTDLVQSSVALTLANNVENLLLMGTSGLSGTGNVLNNVLTGNSGNNRLTGAAGNDVLDGGTGTDTLLGGTGDDTYIVNVSADVVTENANEGLDTVQSIVTWTLGSNLENLTLTGTSAINGTGNAANNWLAGNSAANTLSGAAGDDTYSGGAGNDTLTDTSTSSNDVYRWGLGQGSDTLTDSGGAADRIELSAGISSSQVSLSRSGNNLRIGVTGTTETLTVVNWYANAANRIEQIVLADGTTIPGTAAPASALTSNLRMGADSTSMDVISMAMRTSLGRLLDARTDLLIQAMAGFGAEGGIGASPPIDRVTSIHPVLAASSI